MFSISTERHTHARTQARTERERKKEIKHKNQRKRLHHCRHEYNLNKKMKSSFNG